MKHSISYTTDNIRLVPLDEVNSELYRQLRNEDENRCMFFDSKIIDKNQQEKWFNNYLQKMQEYMFAIYDIKTDAFAGGIGIYNIDNVENTAEVGRIVIDKKFKGKGYGSEAINALSIVAKEHLGLKEIYAHIYANNAPSMKSFINAGFLNVFADGHSVRVTKKL